MRQARANGAPTAERPDGLRCFSFVETRRVLFSTDTNEVPQECVASVLEIRSFLSDVIGDDGVANELPPRSRFQQVALAQHGHERVHVADGSLGVDPESLGEDAREVWSARTVDQPLPHERAGAVEEEVLAAVEVESEHLAFERSPFERSGPKPEHVACVSDHHGSPGGNLARSFPMCENKNGAGALSEA